MCYTHPSGGGAAVAGVGENARDDCRSFDISSSERERGPSPYLGLWVR